MNNSRILRTKNAKFSGYYFYLKTNVQGDFQICIRVPLKLKEIKLSETKLPNFSLVSIRYSIEKYVPTNMSLIYGKSISFTLGLTVKYTFREEILAKKIFEEFTFPICDLNCQIFSLKLQNNCAQFICKRKILRRMLHPISNQHMCNDTIVHTWSIPPNLPPFDLACFYFSEVSQY